MKYTDEYIRQLKQHVSITKLITYHGVKLKKQGKQYKGLCPFHNDTKTESLSVDETKGVYHCFGANCPANRGGDSITFVMQKSVFVFNDAVKWLADWSHFSFSSSEGTRPKSQTYKNESQPAKPNTKKFSEKKKRDMFNRYIEICQNNLTQSETAQTYLKHTRGINNNHIIKQFRVGFATGNVENMVTDNTEQKEILQELGLLNENGKEKFKGMLVFPVFSGNSPFYLYGRSVQHNTKFKHQYINGSHRGVYNEKAFKVFDEIIICECIIDALTLINNGIQNVSCLYGINGLTDEIKEAITSNNVKKIYWALDNGEKEKKKAGEYAQLFANVTNKWVQLPEGTKDINDYFVNGNTNEQFNTLVLKSKYLFGPRDDDFEEIITGSLVEYIFHEQDFTFQVRGVPKKYTPPLKVSLILTYIPTGQKHYDNIDLYSFSRRQTFSRQVSQIFCVDMEEFSGSLLKVLERIEKRNNERVEEKKTEDSGEKKIIVIPDKLKKEALKMLTSPDLYKIIAKDIDTIGFIGEPLNATLAYTIGVSHKTPNPSSVLIRSRSSAGKSALADAVEYMTPEEDLFSVTSLTKQSLYYVEKNGLKNKLIRFGEHIQDEDILYQIRELLSSGKISKNTTVKDEDGNMKSKKIVSDGPVSVIDTSTHNEMNEENLSRYIQLNIDETQGQTEKILKYQRFLRTKEGYFKRQQRKTVIDRHKAAIRLLEPLTVFNPFATLLDYPTKKLIARRGNAGFLDTIEHIAFVHQKQREIFTMPDRYGHELRYINTTIEDYALAYDMFMSGVLVNILSNLSDMTRKMHEAIVSYRYKKSKQEGKKVENVLFTRRELIDYTGYSPAQVRDYMQKLEDYEIIESVYGGRGGKSKVCKLIHETAEEIDLSMVPKPEEVAEKLAELKKKQR